MPRPPTATVDQRLKRIPVAIEALRRRPLAAEDLLEPVNRGLARSGVPGISLRTLQHDLEWMRDRLGPEVLERLPRSALGDEVGPGVAHRRWFYRLNAIDALIPVVAEFGFITEYEALALRTAQAVLAPPPGPDGGPATGAEGSLAGALARLAGRLGLDGRRQPVPDIIGVNHTAPQPYAPRDLLTALRAIRTGDALRMRYASLGKAPRELVVQPVRLALTDGEPYLWAWDPAASKVKNYKMARVSSAQRIEGLRDVPAGLDGEVRSALLRSFRGVAGEAQRARVVIRIAPAGIPHVRDRRLGGAQEWTELPSGEVRIAFNTAGLDAVRHWLLQFGALAVAEQPPALVTWMRAQARSMAEGYGPG